MLYEVITALVLRGARDRFPVRDLRASHARLHLELPHQPVHDDFQVQFPHAGDQRLPRLLVHLHPEGGVLVGKLLKGKSRITSYNVCYTKLLRELLPHHVFRDENGHEFPPVVDGERLV